MIQEYACQYAANSGQTLQKKVAVISDTYRWFLLYKSGLISCLSKGINALLKFLGIWIHIYYSLKHIETDLALSASVEIPCKHI